MPLNKDLIDVARNLPHDDEAAPGRLEEQVLRSLEIRELAIDGDVDELARRCRAELSPDAYALAWAWANAVEAETGDYYSDAEARKHVDREGAEPWPACCTWILDGERDHNPAA